MGLTFEDYYGHFQDWINDDSASALVRIKNMVNAAYKSILALLPSHWTEKQGTVLLATNGTVSNLAADCFRLISIDYPAGDTSPYKPTIVMAEDWAAFRVPVDSTGQPLIFYAGGYSTSGGTKHMQLYNFPAVGTSYSGTHPYRYLMLPADMSTTTDVPVFDDRWQGLLLEKCRVQALLWDGKVGEAGKLSEMNQRLEALYLGREDSAQKKEEK